MDKRSLSVRIESGELVEPGGEATLPGARDIDLAGHRHGPGEALIDAQQHIAQVLFTFQIPGRPHHILGFRHFHHRGAHLLVGLANSGLDH